MSMKRAADHLVESLIAHGADMAFGVAGESYLPVLDAFYSYKDRFKFITARHEGGAGFMAEAYGKLTGKAGLCFVTRGPGAMNAAIAIHSSFQNSTPMILFIGQIARADRDREAFQEMNYRAVFSSFSKWVTEIDNPRRIAETIRRGFTIALSNRPGPVVIALPEDMLRETYHAPSPKRAHITPSEMNKEGVARAIALLKTAQKPLVIVGGGGWNDEERAALHHALLKSNLPVVAGFRAQDLVDHTLPNYIGDAGVGMPTHVKDALLKADLLCVLGLRFGEMLTNEWRLFNFEDEDSQKLIHTHRSAEDLHKIYPADCALEGSPLALLKALGAYHAPNWGEQYRECYLKARHAGINPLLEEFCASLNEALPQDAILTNGAGNFAKWPSRYFDLGGKRRLIAPQSGAMGAGIPASVAAKLLYPNRKTICFAGDGDFQMSGFELSAAMQVGVKPNVIILNNSSYGTIRDHQEKHFPQRVSGTEIINPSFEKFAHSVGYDYLLLETKAQIEPTVSRLTSQDALIVEIKEG